VKILITGAGGDLGRVLVPALVEAGQTPRLMDSRPLDTPYEFVQGDVRDSDAVRKAMADADAIVHAAALHGIHLSKYTPHDFWAINMSGTFHMYQTARELGIKRVVLCSTMGVYGESARPPEIAFARLIRFPSRTAAKWYLIAMSKARHHDAGPRYLDCYLVFVMVMVGQPDFSYINKADASMHWRSLPLACPSSHSTSAVRAVPCLSAHISHIYINPI
jgi:nucleoside-diphosphate-sugar epimerase